MYWETCIEALQTYGLVSLKRAEGRWFATWEVRVEVEGGPIIDQPTKDGQTPAEAVKNLWELFCGKEGDVMAGPRLRISVGHEHVVTRWNGRWPEVKRRADAVTP